MSPLNQELARINGQINRWRAFEYALGGFAALLCGWFVLSLLDLWLRPRGLGRLALSLLLVASAVAGLLLLGRVLGRRRSPAAVAALLECHFPQLDNHLINHVLFTSAVDHPTPWLHAYLNEVIPGWSSLPLAELKNRRWRRIGAAALAAVILLLILPTLFCGPTWLVALRRVANPFSTLTPPTFASVSGVEPGNVTVLQGASVTFAVRARGRAGQSITLEHTPADDPRALIRLGAFDATDTEQTFVYTLPKVTAPASYRFHVGDAWPTELYTVTTVAPLAVAELTLAVTPPAYTRIPSATLQALDAIPAIPARSTVTVALALNRAAGAADLALDEAPPLAMTPAEGGRRWTATLHLASGSLLRVVARDAVGGRLVQEIRFALVADSAPAIRVTAPAGRGALPPGALPAITFEVRDDYGLKAVRLERIPRNAQAADPGVALAHWEGRGDKTLNGQWSGTLDDLAGATAFRIVAEDGMDPAPVNRTVSPAILFEPVLITAQYQAQLQQRGEARKNLGQLVAWQRGNLAATTRHLASLPGFDPAAWEALRVRQCDIRAYATEMLHTNTAALGAARVVVEKARAPMAEAVAQFDGVQTAPPESRAAAAAAALNTQKLILRLLTLAEEEAGGSQPGQGSSGILAMIEALLKGQTAVRSATETALLRSEPVADATVERQAALALDLSELVELTRRDAGMAREGDPLRLLMTTVADTIDTLKIKADMLRAAQALQGEAVARALAPQANATNSLHTLMRLLAEWKSEETDQRSAQALATLRDAREAIKKLEKLQAGIIEALRATETQGDKSDGAKAELLDEIVVLKAMMAESMLKVATDLQSLPELDAANELVTDCYQIYEAMDQVKESEKQTEASELGLQKEDFWLEEMAKTGEKLDEMEHWLANRPDDIQRNMENFDQAEVQSAIPKIGMPEELQDLIGDLLDEQEDLAKKTADSLTSQGAANPALGWEIAEGETVDYSAGGKTGNRRPDHKEQDGRSQIGRAGMADGEIMAKSGRINAGDEAIDKRRTKDSSQSGNVVEEGHADAKATGGGKNAGYADEQGMAGTGSDPRRQSNLQQSGEQVRQAELARLADTVYAKAQLNGLTIPPGFNRARENMRRAAEAGRVGQLAQMREFQNRAVQDLVTAQSSMDTGLADESMGVERGDGRSPDASVASTPDEAPAGFRDLVSEYFKAIGEMN